jgi:hypothetical protein
MAFPSVTLSKFWENNLRLYEKRNAVAKAFFTKFKRDPVRHAKILSDHALRREIRRIRCGSSVPYVPPEWLMEP